MSTDKFRKKPVVIEAFQLPAAGDGDTEPFLAWAEKVGFDNWNSARDEGLDIETLEGVMRADPGDWVIKGVKGEFYPCKPDIFGASYEPADSSPRYELDSPALEIAQKIMECRATAAEDGWPDVRLKAAIQCLVIEAMKWAAPEQQVAMQNFRDSMQGIGHIRRTIEETFGGLHGTHCEPDTLRECKAICDAICDAYRNSSPTVSAAWGDVIAERQRQVSAEGWTPEHDDQHISGELAGAAACYARHVNERQWVYPDEEKYRLEDVPLDWPWNDEWWKPKSPRRDLVRAGALILAEIERLDRDEAAAGGDDA